MRATDGQTILSATDLANHLGCRHLTALELAAVRGEMRRPLWRDPMLEVLQQRGMQHEEAYLEHLRGQGRSVVRADAGGNGGAATATAAAMRDGADIIVQATLASGAWHGRADILCRVDTASALGDWSYEVVDTKLARQTRAGTMLQLCLYSDLVAELQGQRPELMHVVSPGEEFVEETYRVAHYAAYYRLIRRRLLAATANAGAAATTYPEPVPQCDVCRWWSACNARRRADDHPSFVAGISTSQRRELEAWGVTTLTGLARLPLPLTRKPQRGAAHSYVRVREQARVQLESQQQDRPVFELLPREQERGLARLPAPSPGDLFFDIEGDPFVGTGGLEYLLGWVSVDAAAPEYYARWAFTEDDERAAFEAFVDEVMTRWQRFPDLHIYHFAPYEPGALKRLMGRYATRENEIDRMLRARLFVDLHSVTRQAVRAGVERYSIKDLEPLYRFTRDTDLRDASLCLRAVEHALELGHVDAVPADLRTTVRDYNRDDCVSTLHLRDWLERLRAELVEDGEALPRPAMTEAEPSASLGEREQRVRELAAPLLRDVPANRSERDAEQHARWLLAHLLEWHRREEKAAWWEFFRLGGLDDEELIAEDMALAGLRLVEDLGGRKGTPIHRYRFAPQETRLRAGDQLHQHGGIKIGSVAAIDLPHALVDIKKRRDAATTHPTAVFASNIVPGAKLEEALVRLGDWVVAHGVDAPGQYRAARDLLCGLAPRLNSRPPTGALLAGSDETPDQAARRLGLELNHGVLAIQGPPGAGKTYTAARMICDLVAAGKKIAITAVSHKVIRNLLDEVVSAAQQRGLTVHCIQKVSGKAADDTGQPIQETTANAAVVEALQSGSAQVAAGTAWLWAREDLFEAVDVLFVDEAGQMSLAFALAVAQAARNIVLLGDPQQLEQPQQGSHPEGTDVSTLHHLLAGHQTIAADRGLFLDMTWRLHPAICAMTSELFYEGRLQARPHLQQQALVGGPFTGAGLWFVPVAHEGNQSSSHEEVERVVALYRTLLESAVGWVDQDGKHAQLGATDVLVVAPYNAQVSALGERLPDARIGTVDKFQGQEAPVVIYSMATSTPEDAPRGMEFLFSLNRLNVATSRARCVCILVASPRLFEPDCRTPRQIRLASAFCRYVELAHVGPATQARC